MCPIYEGESGAIYEGESVQFTGGETHPLTFGPQLGHENSPKQVATHFQIITTSGFSHLLKDLTQSQFLIDSEKAQNSNRLSSPKVWDDRFIIKSHYIVSDLKWTFTI